MLRMTLPFVGMLLVLLTLDCRNSYVNIDKNTDTATQTHTNKEVTDKRINAE